jgi:hypothetical protein
MVVTRPGADYVAPGKKSPPKITPDRLFTPTPIPTPDPTPEEFLTVTPTGGKKPLPQITSVRY